MRRECHRLLVSPIGLAGFPQASSLDSAREIGREPHAKNAANGHFLSSLGRQSSHSSFGHPVDPARAHDRSGEKSPHPSAALARTCCRQLTANCARLGRLGRGERSHTLVALASIRRLQIPAVSSGGASRAASPIFVRLGGAADLLAMTTRDRCLPVQPRHRPSYSPSTIMSTPEGASRAAAVRRAASSTWMRGDGEPRARSRCRTRRASRSAGRLLPRRGPTVRAQ